MSTPSKNRVRRFAGFVLLVVVLAGMLLHAHQESRCVTCQAAQRLVSPLSIATAACPLVPLGWTRPPDDSAAHSTVALQQILSRAPPA